jgi:hypothetical protein
MGCFRLVERLRLSVAIERDLDRHRQPTVAQTPSEEAATLSTPDHHTGPPSRTSTTSGTSSPRRRVEAALDAAADEVGVEWAAYFDFAAR